MHIVKQNTLRLLCKNCVKCHKRFFFYKNRNKNSSEHIYFPGFSDIHWIFCWIRIQIRDGYYYDHTPSNFLIRAWNNIKCELDFFYIYKKSTGWADTVRFTPSLQFRYLYEYIYIYIYTRKITRVLRRRKEWQTCDLKSDQNSKHTGLCTH